jgi:hypothetical protein
MGEKRKLPEKKEMPVMEEFSEINPTPTPISKEQASSALGSAWQNLFGTPIKSRQLAILIAHWAVETAWGNKMIQYNFGNLKGTSPAGLTTAYTTSEGYGSSKEKTDRHFRAYDNINEGAQDYLSLLKEKYPRATQCIKDGDVEGFVDQLSGVYFTGDPKRYKSNMKSIVQNLSAKSTEENSKKNSKKPSKKISKLLQMANEFEKLAEII